jgi:DNA-directed RNA polymerase specialized sigma24 family protein
MPDRDAGTIWLSPKMAKYIRGPEVPYFDSFGEAIEPESPTQAFRRLLDELPPTDADIIELTLAGKEQWEIGVILGYTQAAISFRLQKAVRRLKFLAGRPKYTREELAQKLSRVVKNSDKNRVLSPNRHPAFLAMHAYPANYSLEIMLCYWTTGSLSHTARELGLHDRTVRGRIEAMISQIESSEDPEMQRIAATYRQLQVGHGWMFRGNAPYRRREAIEARRAAELLDG